MSSKSSTNECCKRTPHLIFILDRSGSMSGRASSMVNAINILLEQQKKTIDNTIVTLVTFSAPILDNQSHIEYVFEKTPLANVPYMTYQQYQCGGGTALFDTIKEVLVKYKDNPDTLVCIVTDGQDLDSVNTTDQEMKACIQERKRTNPISGIDEGWKFIYLCTDISSVQSAANVGITRRGESSTQSAAVDPDMLGSVLTRQISRACSEYREVGEVSDLSNTLEDLSLDEEKSHKDVISIEDRLSSLPSFSSVRPKKGQMFRSLTESKKRRNPFDDWK